jgi:hypothetical protein
MPESFFKNLSICTYNIDEILKKLNYGKTDRFMGGGFLTFLNVSNNM